MRWLVGGPRSLEVQQRQLEGWALGSHRGAMYHCASRRPLHRGETAWGTAAAIAVTPAPDIGSDDIDTLRAALAAEQLADFPCRCSVAARDDFAVDPRAWLANVLARISDHPVRQLDELLPWTWREAQAETAVAA